MLRPETTMAMMLGLREKHHAVEEGVTKIMVMTTTMTKASHLSILVPLLHPLLWLQPCLLL
jgi:hypothetical protein